MYKLTYKQELKFEELYLRYQDKIKLVVYKCNISQANYDHFYSYAMEGFLQAFLIFDAGDLDEKDFPAFVYTTMKRKIIDELRRCSRYKDITVNLEDKQLNLAYIEDDFEIFLLNNSLESNLNDREKRIVSLLKNGATYKEIINKERVSKSCYYNILTNIRSKYEHILYK